MAKGNFTNIAVTYLECYVSKICGDRKAADAISVDEMTVDEMSVD